jgi:FSR family fosmidomycin resistance protein-like MFS transporter
VIIGVVIASFFGNFSFCSGINAGKSGYDFGILVSLLAWEAWVLLLGYLADQTSIEYVYKISSYLPLIGIFTYFYLTLKESYFHLNLVLFMNIRGSFRDFLINFR